MLAVLLFLVLKFSLASNCNDWFTQLKIKPNASECLSICQTSQVDMSSFSCPNLCDKFCKSKSKCNNNNKIIQIDTLPKNWPFKNDKTLSLSTEQKQVIFNAIKNLPESFFVNLSGIYFLEKPRDLFSLGTESSYFENNIVIYQKAFENVEKISSYIIHELGHHLHESIEAKEFRNYTNEVYKVKSRVFLTADSKDSAEEDFATNFEFFILKKQELKKTDSQIEKWFTTKFKNKYYLLECP